MISRKLIAAAVLLSMSAGALAETIYEFASITKLTNNGNGITGVLVNDTVPTTLTLTSVIPQCFNWLELMMKSPGVYNLSVTVLVVASPPVNGITSCILEVRP